MRWRGVASTAVIAVAMVAANALAGCGVSAAPGPARPGPRPAAMPLATAMAGQRASWAIVRLAGSGDNVFWQLLVRTAGGRHWRLATPPGVADTGGLVLAGTPGGPLTAGFVPSELLRFTPLATTGNSGTTWAQGLLPAALAAEPGALAALPSGRLLAITSTSAELSVSGAASWSTLVTVRSLAASTAGRTCGLTGLTAAASSAAGAPLLAGGCAKPGQVGIFTRAAGSWRPAGPVLPAALARQQPVTVLRLTASTGGEAALLAAGAGRQEVLIPAWLTEHRTTWTVGRPLTLNGAKVESVSAGAGGQWGLVLSGGRGEILAGAAGAAGAAESWQTISLPPATTIVLPGPGQITALAPGDSSVSVWQLGRAQHWQQTQVIAMPVIAGSSS